MDCRARLFLRLVALLLRSSAARAPFLRRQRTQTGQPQRAQPCRRDAMTGPERDEMDKIREAAAVPGSCSSCSRSRASARASELRRRCVLGPAAALASLTAAGKSSVAPAPRPLHETDAPAYLLCQEQPSSHRASLALFGRSLLLVLLVLVLVLVLVVLLLHAYNAIAPARGLHMAGSAAPLPATRPQLRGCSRRRQQSLK
ncbi:hypothetical protein B0J12DRAFT_699138 [Macrophomina phaseolina]|uniref:Uncharacterized protein n=1 Tax=Macrophomina phaseolina TaxID=35725 RepID=A0ABQ8GBI0_9PEZI|nr:hypothetical protein B0J12DRAFT_699138 [Macrophomina phaseolina]